MGGRKKIVVMAATALACLAVLLLLLRDWNAEIARLAAQVENATGLRVVISGASRLTLLPPALAVENVSVVQGDARLAQIKRLSLRVSPLSLLSGRVQVTGLVFDQARVGGTTVDGLDVHLSPNRLDGFSKWNGHAVTFGASLSATQDKAAQFRLTIPTLNTTLRFEGTLEKGPALSGQLTLNAGNLAGLLPELGLPPGRTLQAQAEVDWGDGQFSLVNLGIETNGTRAGGSVVALAGSPALVEADLDLDRLDIDSWHGGKSSVLPHLLPATLTPPTNVTTTSAKPQDAAAAKTERPALLPDNVLGNLRLNVGQVTWLGQTLRGIDIRAGLDQGSLVIRHAGAQFGQDLRADLDGVLEQASFTGRLRLNGPGISGRSDLAVDAQGLRLGNFLAKHDDLLVKGALAGSWHDGVTVRWSGAIGTWSDTAAAAKLVPQGRKLEMPEVEARIGTLSIRGQANADFSAPRPHLTAQLRAGDVDLTALPGSPLPVFVPPQPKLKGKAVRPSPPAPAAKTASNKKGGSPFSATPLDWSALTLVDGVFDVAATSLSGEFGRLDRPRMKLTVADGNATIDDLGAGFLDGQVTAKGRLAALPQPSLQLEAQVKGADLARLRPGIAGLSLASGRADGQIRVKAVGRSSREMAASAVGDGRLEAKDGTVDGIDLAAIDGQVSRIQNIGNILALAQTGLKGGQTRFKTLSGTLKLADGTARSPDLTLKAEGGSLAADLSVALVPWTTDSSLSLALASLPATPLALRFSGPVDTPRTVVDANALQKALVQGGLGRALGVGESKGGGKILRNIFKALGGG